MQFSVGLKLIFVPILSRLDFFHPFSIYPPYITFNLSFLHICCILSRLQSFFCSPVAKIWVVILIKYKSQVFYGETMDMKDCKGKI